MTRSSWEVEKSVEKAADKAPAPVQSADKPTVKSAEIDNLFSGWFALSTKIIQVRDCSAEVAAVGAVTQVSLMQS